MLIGQWLRELRHRSQLSLRQLDSVSGVHWGTIHRTEQDKRACTLPELERMAQAWGVTVQDILGWAKVEAKFPAKGCSCQDKEGA